GRPGTAPPAPRRRPNTGTPRVPRRTGHRSPPAAQPSDLRASPPEQRARPYPSVAPAPERAGRPPGRAARPAQQTTPVASRQRSRPASPQPRRRHRPRDPAPAHPPAVRPADTDAPGPGRAVCGSYAVRLPRMHRGGAWSRLKSTYESRNPALSWGFLMSEGDWLTTYTHP